MAVIQTSNDVECVTLIGDRHGQCVEWQRWYQQPYTKHRTAL